MPQEREKAKTSAPIVSQIITLIWMEFDLLFRHVSLMDLLPIVFRQISIQVREPAWVIALKMLKISLRSNIHRPVNFFQTWYDDSDH